MAGNQLFSPNLNINKGDSEAKLAAEAKAEIRRDRSLVRQLAEILKFADLMAIMMVLATLLSAIATWRTASITNLLVSIAERPTSECNEWLSIRSGMTAAAAC